MVKVFFYLNQNKLYHDVLLSIWSHSPVAAALESRRQNRGTRHGEEVRTSREEGRRLMFDITRIIENFTLSCLLLTCNWTLGAEVNKVW